jgi:hypothetical protein
MGFASARLLPDLQIAIATLYSLPLPQDVTQYADQSQAHDFLQHIQSRNVRRKIHSLQQRHRDQAMKQQPTSTTNQQQTIALPREDETTVRMGSSWLPCLILLCQLDGSGRPCLAATPTERLFAAQTLLHRLRRIKIVEAIDLDVELDHDLEESQALYFYESMDHAVNLLSAYKNLMERMNPFVAMVLSPYLANVSSVEDEERTKAELTLLTLGAIAFLIASDPQANDQMMPLLSTIGHSMAVVALRIRYTPSSVDAPQGPSSPPIVTLIEQALSAAWNTAPSVSLPQNHEVMCVTLNIAFGAIPDALLGSPGGARGRLSMDPRCIQAATHELITGLRTLWESLKRHEVIHSHWTLRTMERWAKFVPLDHDLVTATVPLVREYAIMDGPHGKDAFEYLIAIFESGSWTVDQVLATSMGLTDEKRTNQSGRKRQSSRSKKRQKELVDSRTTDTAVVHAENEVQQRGQSACLVAMQVWNILRDSAERALTQAKNERIQVEGEGPIGCIATCANACLPHLLRHPAQPNAQELFAQISGVVQNVCASDNKAVRGLVFESLFTLHATMLNLVREEKFTDPSLESLMVDHFYHCSMNLAVRCGYPDSYFVNLAASSDEEIEVERNDVRDVVRAIACSEEGGSTSEVITLHRPLETSLKILSKLLHACVDAVNTALSQRLLPSEAIVHAFSALAKPLNHVAKANASNSSCELCILAMKFLISVTGALLKAFEDKKPILLLLPICRTASIAMASVTPMLSSLVQNYCDNRLVLGAVRETLDVCIRGSIVSVAELPELASASELHHAQYDIRGTMRGPGGEDHVGCLVLMRFVDESEALSKVVIDVARPYLSQLCDLYQHLKSIESNRERGVHHGRGVAPKSRRILLSVLCHLETLSRGQGGASTMLLDIFDRTIETIVNMNGHVSSGETKFYFLCEATLDIAAFSSTLIRSLFEPDDDVSKNSRCLEMLADACVKGYRMINPDPPSPEIYQWNRYRAAIFSLLKAAAHPDLPERSINMIQILISAECDAIATQCTMMPLCSSSLFNDEVVSPETVPAGLFVKVLGDVIGESHSYSHICAQVLWLEKDVVLNSILLECGDPEITGGDFVDPRCTLLEAWLLCMSKIVSSKHSTVEPFVETLLSETCVVLLSLLFSKTVATTQEDRGKDPCLSLDGPHTLAAMEFLSAFLSSGFGFQALSEQLRLNISFDFPSLPFCDASLHGSVIIGAALFRAMQGALPPWAVESIPEVYSAFFTATGRNPELFGAVLRSSMEIRLSERSTMCGVVQRGELLSGRYFEGTSEKAKEQFVDETIDLCRSDTASSWRRMKVLVKQVCGGKKKDSDCKQKPSYTRWDFERL